MDINKVFGVNKSMDFYQELFNEQSDDTPEGWKITLFVVAGLCLSCAFFGYLMRPLELPEDESEDIEKNEVSVCMLEKWLI